MNTQTDVERKGSLCICVCVCRSPQEAQLARLPMEPIEEENIEMPEAETDAERRDMLRYLIHFIYNTLKIQTHTHFSFL